MDEYQNQLARLYQINISPRDKWSLEGVTALTKPKGDPQTHYPTVHVAGTNGKGSVSTKIASTLCHAGYKVGLFTSPHISTFRERIQINGEMIDKASCSTLLQELFSIESTLSTFFDYVTALGLLYFSREKVDIAIIEVGLGGRLDSTNIISPLLSVITTIGFDHTEILGDTLEKIAIEKGGIIKPNTPVLIGPDVPFKPIEKLALEKNAPLVQLDQKFSHFDLENQNTAIHALKLIENHFPHDQKNISFGRLCKPACRIQEIDTYPFPIFLDVAHNPHGIEASLRTIQSLYPKQPIDIVFGLSASKDIPACIKALEPHFLYPTEANNPRAAPKSVLEEELKKRSIAYQSLDTFESTLMLALDACKKRGSLLVILGSVFLMREARSFFNIAQEIDPFELNEKFTSISSK